MKEAAVIEAEMPAESRYENRKQYFDEQSAVTKEYIIPYIDRIFPITSNMSVCEIGCGEAGNLLPFLDMGCKVTGIDISANKIRNANFFYANHPKREKITLRNDNIFKTSPDKIGKSI